MSKNTIYEKACNKVAGFRSMSEEFTRKLVIYGRSKSTHENYLRQMAKLAVHYNESPLDLEIDQLEEYLYHLVQNDSDSRSSFKHLVYGLRKLYHLFGKDDLQISLPSISRPNKLPVVLSGHEVKRLLKASGRIGDRVMFGLIYDAGLRISELTNLLIGDVDLDRGQVHVRQSKNKKDRYVPISGHAVRGVRKHLALNSPKDYLFESPKRKGIPISKTLIRNLLKEAIVRAGIRKDVCVHTLRHTYATHQLEAGQNIMTLKDLLGHGHISTTLMYLHMSQLAMVNKFGCMDTIYGPLDA
ncbi:MAG: tyrosine-type recombinase/integrase [Cyclobacteriaceae bacterium]|nr:tyrosine-type recombinase/integrase [Cyclobacteriaceae bacterium]